MFAISSQPITVDAAGLADAKAGAFVSFEGRVRNHNDGHEVQGLEYDVYEALAVAEGMRIVDEAILKFGLHHAAAVHRAGKLSIGEIAVWIGVTSSHRAEAFRACAYIIDQIKTRLPIWKREFYADGTTEWVNCQHCAEHVSPHVHAEKRESIPA